MSTRLHLTLGIAAEAAGMVLAFALFVRFAADSGVPGFVLVLLFLAAGAAGMILPGAAFWWLVPARCGRCGGAAYRRRRGRRITYVCRSCDHVHDTGVREGRWRAWPRP
jgi:hypothetical protein